MYKKKILLLSLVILTVFACQRGGGYRDMAMITDAKRNLRGVKNALEEYWVDNATYPEEGTDLEAVLKPYFLRVRYKENEDAAIHAASIQNARNQLDNITNLLANAKRQIVPRLDSCLQKEMLPHMERVGNLISQYMLEIEAIEIPPVEIDVEDELKAMLDILKEVNPELVISEIDDNLVQKGREIIQSLDELKKRIAERVLDSVMVMNATYKADAISRTFKVYEAYLTHQPLAQAEVVIPEREFENIETVLDTLAFDSLLIQVMEDIRGGINQYRSLEMRKDDMAVLLSGIQMIERATAIMLKYEGTIRKNVQTSAIVLEANVALHKMAKAIESYRREIGVYPPEDAALDSILHPCFIEITMGGDTIDRYEENLSYLEGFPSYLVVDPTSGFELRARVANEARTPIFSRVEIVSDWEKVVSAFAQGPTYRTIDPKVTYFLTAMAKDSRKTLICERSPVREEKKAKK
ncbi:MAG: hypothetical protein Q7J55_00630 [bacterium]|nr:hypothetical protein [bacterium]